MSDNVIIVLALLVAAVVIVWLLRKQGVTLSAKGPGVELSAKGAASPQTELSNVDAERDVNADVDGSLRAQNITVKRDANFKVR
jgi:hypothetical protein